MYNYKAKIKAVESGDTVVAEVDLGFSIFKEMKLQLYGVNTPKIEDPERAAGVETRDILREKILGKHVEIHSYKKEAGEDRPYRVTILHGDLNINQWLIDNEYAIRV
jgi:endonuclease YncB( thermonuclease family)